MPKGKRIKEYVLELTVLDTSAQNLKALKSELADKIMDLKDAQASCITNDTDWTFKLNGKVI